MGAHNPPPPPAPPAATAVARPSSSPTPPPAAAPISQQQDPDGSFDYFNYVDPLDDAYLEELEAIESRQAAATQSQRAPPATAPVVEDNGWLRDLRNGTIAIDDSDEDDVPPPTARSGASKRRRVVSQQEEEETEVIEISD